MLLRPQREYRSEEADQTCNPGLASLRESDGGDGYGGSEGETRSELGENGVKMRVGSVW
jgi:hypothetical protein